MPVSLGDTSISKLYLGSTEVPQAYLGSSQVFNSTPPNGLLNGLVSYYKADTNGSFPDVHGSNDGIINGASYTLNGKINGGYESDGINDNITINNTQSLTDYTFNIWINPNSIPTGNNFGEIFGVFNSSSQYIVWLMIYQQKFYALQGVGGANGVIHPTTPVPVSGAWQMLTLVGGGTSLTLFLDGSQIGTVSSGTFSQVSSFIRLFSGFNYTGPIDEFGFWNKSLSTTEILGLYNSGSGLSYDNFTT